MLFDNTVLYKQRRIFFFQHFPHNVWKKTLISYLINRNKTFILRFQRKHLKRFIALKRFITLLCIITEKENMFQQMEWQSNRNRIFTRKQIIKKPFCSSVKNVIFSFHIRINGLEFSLLSSCLLHLFHNQGKFRRCDGSGQRESCAKK